MRHFLSEGLIYTSPGGCPGLGVAIAEVGKGREKAQKAQEMPIFPNRLRLLRLFAASSAIGSGLSTSRRHFEALRAFGCGTPLRLALAGGFAQSLTHVGHLEVRGLDRCGGLLALRLVQPARVHGAKAHLVDQFHHRHYRHQDQQHHHRSRRIKPIERVNVLLGATARFLINT
jgi:hypothetical protein